MYVCKTKDQNILSPFFTCIVGCRNTTPQPLFVINLFNLESDGKSTKKSATPNLHLEVADSLDSTSKTFL